MLGPTDTLVLSDEELAFLRLTCNLFPAAESPLYFLETENVEPDDPERVFSDLTARGLLDSRGAGASPEALARLEPVCECAARVLVTSRDSRGSQVRDYYLRGETSVAYQRTKEGHAFGPAVSESALVEELLKAFRPAGTARLGPLRMSPGDYLVFAVFAHDVRTAADAAGKPSGMSVTEVLAYFDEPEPAMPTESEDASWQASVERLVASGVLNKKADGYALSPAVHSLARQIVADHQHTAVRFDYLDERWLVREVSLYPAPDAVYRLGTQADGSVLVEELDRAQLESVLRSTVATLPSVLKAEGSSEPRLAPAKR